MNDRRENFDKMREKCAVFGVSTNSGVAAELAYNALLTMQHRGQDGAGIAVVKDNIIGHKKGRGLVTEVFAGGALDGMAGSGIAVGHCLSSGGDNPADDAQPYVTEYLTGRIAVVLNGSISNIRELKKELMSYGLTFAGTSDGELLSKLVAYYCMINESVLEGVKYAVRFLQGSFSLVALITGKEGDKLFAVRDSSGLRPLCIGVSEEGVAVASESCALDICGFGFARDIKPGEVVMIEGGRVSYEEVALAGKSGDAGLCIFEYVYYARPDSFMDNLSVYQARVNMGRILARENKDRIKDADFVSGVPDSGIEAALGYSLETGLPMIPAFVRNRYIGRSFIYPTQLMRENAVKVKYNPLESNVRGKRIILVDDSIVRGTSSDKVVGRLKDAGAGEVHMLVSSPPIKFACKLGCIDEDNEKNLIAGNNASIEEIGRSIGADSLNYISVDGLKEACRECALSQCLRCFVK